MFAGYSMGELGSINMAHGEFMILGAYVTFLTSRLFTTYMPSFFSAYSSSPSFWRSVRQAHLACWWSGC